MEIFEEFLEARYQCLLTTLDSAGAAATTADNDNDIADDDDDDDDERAVRRRMRSVVEELQLTLSHVHTIFCSASSWYENVNKDVLYCIVVKI